MHLGRQILCGRAEQCHGTREGAQGPQTLGGMVGAQAARCGGSLPDPTPL